MNAQVLESVDTGEDLTQPPANSAGDSPSAPPANDATSAPAAAPPAAPSEPPPAPVRQDVVPHAALHEAREQNKALRAQIAALEAQPRLTTDDADLLKQLRQQRQPAEQTPDFLENPKGYIDSKVTGAIKELQTVKEATNQTREQLQQQEQQRQIIAAASAHEQTFAAQTPDYFQAIQHIRNIRTQQLQMFYPSATPVQIQQQIAREELGGAAQAMSAGLNPAEMVYKYAQTLGYQPPKPTTAAAAAPATPPAAKPDPSAARTLGSGGGASPTPDPSDSEDAMPELTAALKERFGVSRKR